MKVPVASRPAAAGRVDGVAAAPSLPAALAVAGASAPLVGDAGAAAPSSMRAPVGVRRLVVDEREVLMGFLPGQKRGGPVLAFEAVGKEFCREVEDSRRKSRGVRLQAFAFRHTPPGVCLEVYTYDWRHVT